MSEFEGFLGATYLWVRAAHVIFVIFLMAAMFMMPRFFIYHHQCPVGSEEDAKWLDRENRLRKIILNPSIIMVWVLGLMLATHLNLWAQHWFHAKLLLVTILSVYHGWLIRYFKELREGRRRMREKALRLWNEVPGIIAVIVVILVIVRPF